MTEVTIQIKNNDVIMTFNYLFVTERRIILSYK